MALTNKLKPQVDIPVWEWCRLAPNTSSSVSSTTAADNSIYHVTHGRYIYYMQATTTTAGATGTGTGFWRYDTITDTYMQLAFPPIAPATYSNLQFLGGHGYNGRVLSAGTNWIQCAALTGQTLKSFDIRIQSGTGTGQHRVVTGVSDVTIADNGTVTAAGTTPQIFVTDSNKNWALNQWVGYQIRFVGNTGNSQVRKIIYNTQNTIYWSDNNKFAEEQFAWSPVLALGPMALAAAGSFYQIESSVITVDTPWTTMPDATSKFIVHSGAIWMLTAGTTYLLQYYDIAADTWYVRNSAAATSPVIVGTTTGDAFLTNTGEVAQIVARGQGNGTQSSTTLQDTNQSWATNVLSAGNCSVRIFSGTGNGQLRTIASNTPNTITVSQPWTTTPDSTSLYEVDSFDGGNVTTAGSSSQSGIGSGTISSNVLNIASMTSGAFYPGQVLYGTGTQTANIWISNSAACFSTASSGTVVTLAQGTTLGPLQYTSAIGATSSSNTITVGSTAGLAVGMIVIVTAGTGAFTFGTTVIAINGTTTFTASASPSVTLSGGSTVVTGQFGVVPGMQVSFVPGATGGGTLVAPTTVSSVTLTTITLSSAPTVAMVGATLQCSNVWTSGSIATASNGNLVTVPNTTAFPGTVGLYPGMLVTMISGTGTITAGTYVESILDSTHFYLSTNPTTAIAVGAFIQAQPYPTLIQKQLTGAPGGVGTYSVWPQQIVNTAAITGCSSSSTTVTTTGTTLGLVPGMLVTVTAGTGTFAAGTYVSSITDSTHFVVSASPSVTLSGATVTPSAVSFTGLGTATVTDASKTWPVNRWNGQQVRIISGTGSGQYRSILNTTTGIAAGTVMYTSAATTASSSGTTITLGTGSTAGLMPGMVLNVTAGTGAFTFGTTVSQILTSLTFTCSAAPATPLSAATITGAVGYISNAGATSSGTTITVNSTASLVVGMLLQVTAGIGAFTYGTTVATIVDGTHFTSSAVPTTALSGGSSVVTGTSINTLTVYPNWTVTPDNTSVYLIHGDNDKMYFTLGGTNASAATAGMSSTFIHNIDSDTVTMGRMVDYGVARGNSAQFGDQVAVAVSAAIQGAPVTPITYLFGGGAVIAPAGCTGNNGQNIVTTTGTTIGLTPGMTVSVTAGTGSFPAATYITGITGNTTFTISQNISVTLVAATVTQAANALAYYGSGPFNIATLGGTGSTATATFSSVVSGSLYSGSPSSLIIPVGTIITILNCLPSGYNGTWTVTSSSAGSVSFACTATGSQTQVGSLSFGPVLNAAASMFTIVGVVPTAYNSATQTITSAGAGFVCWANTTVGEMTVQGYLQQLPIANTSLTVSGSTATLSTPGTNFGVGTWISVVGSVTVAGASTAGSYNGVYQVVTSSAGSCTYTIPSNTPTGNASVNGTVQLATTTQLISTVNNHHFKTGMTISHKGDTHFASAATNISATITVLVPTVLTTAATQYVYSTGSSYAGTQITFPQPTTMLIDAAKNWVPNQFAGCLVYWNSNQATGTGATNPTILSAVVLANTNNQLIFAAAHTAPALGISRYVITQPIVNPGHAVLGACDSGLALGACLATQIQDVTKFWAMPANVSSASSTAGTGTSTFTLASVNGIIPGMIAVITTNTAGSLTLPSGTTVVSVSPTALTVTLSNNSSGTAGNSTFTFLATANSSGNTVTLAGWNTQYLSVGMYLGVNSVNNIINGTGNQVVVPVAGAFVSNGNTVLTNVQVTSIISATQFTVSVTPAVPLINANIFASAWFANQWLTRKIRYMSGLSTNFLENAYNVGITSVTTAGVVGFATLTQTPVSGVTAYAILQQPIRGVGTALHWASYGLSDYSRRGSFLIQARGGGVTGFDRLNFQNYDQWDFLNPTPNFEAITQGSMYAYDGGSRLYFTVAVTQRVYYLDLNTMQIHGASQFPYALPTAIYGNRMEIFSTPDGLNYLWLNRHSFQECFKQLLFY